MIRAAGVFVVVAATTLIAGCGGTQGLTDPAAVCATGGSMCEKAVEVATARLGGVHVPVTAVHWNLGLCGEGMRCGEGDATDFGWVIFQFMFGDPVMLHVHSVRQADGEGMELVADPPASVPAWVLPMLDQPPSF